MRIGSARSGLNLRRPSPLSSIVMGALSRAAGWTALTAWLGGITGCGGTAADSRANPGTGGGGSDAAADGDARDASTGGADAGPDARRDATSGDASADDASAACTDATCTSGHHCVFGPDGSACVVDRCLDLSCSPTEVC